MKRPLWDVWTKGDTDAVDVADTDFEGYLAVTGAEVDDFQIAGALGTADMFVLPTGRVIALGVVRTDNESTGQTEMVRAGRREIDGLSERSSSTQLLLFCATEAILSPG